MTKKWNEEKIKFEIDQIIKETNCFPTAKYLQNCGRWDLFRAIAKNGGFYHYRMLFDFSITEKGHWAKHYQEEIEKMVVKLKRFPSAKEIKCYSEGLFNFLHRSNLLKKLRKKYKYKPTIKPVGYWNNFENLKAWLYQNFGDMININVFPTSSMIASIKGGRCIANDVISRHGGFIKVAELMGCGTQKCFIAPDGHYLDSKLELILDWYLWSRGIKHKVHGKITKDMRYKYDFKLANNFYVEVWGLKSDKYKETRNKKEKIYNTLGFKLISIEKEIFEKSFPKIEKHLDDIFQQFGFPIKKLNKRHCKNIEDTESRGKGYWTFENTLNELKLIVQQINSFPTTIYLKKIGKYQIQKSMQKYGGQNKFRAILGFPLLKRAE